jgi:2-aminoadipate transaminase
MTLTAPAQGEGVPLPGWTELLRRSPLEELLPTASRGDIISFALGLPAPQLFPVRDCAAAAARVLRAQGQASLQYGPPPPSLKRHVVRLMGSRGVECGEGQVFLTAGAQQGLSLLARLLLGPRGQVLTEELVYTGLQQAVAPYRPRTLTVPTDPETGMDVGAAEALLAGGARPAFLYAVTDGHNPLGVSMSLEKRRRLAGLARRHRVPVVEDDAYGFLHYDEEMLPPLRAFEAEWVFYVGTFSKILVPGFRAGWLVAPPSLAPALGSLKESSDINTATFAQHTVAAYLDAGRLPAHLRALRREYRARRDAMLRALAEHFPRGAAWRSPRSGFFIWVELPGEVNLDEVLRDAIETERVAFVPGRSFSADARPRAARSMRLNFSNCTPERIAEGIARLGRVLRRH